MSSLHRIGSISSSLRRMIFACLAEIFSSENPTPTLTLYPASLKIHITPTLRTQSQLIEGLTQHGFPIFVFISLYLMLKKWTIKDTKRTPKATKLNNRRQCYILIFHDMPPNIGDAMYDVQL